ncbi:exodeoxyribonuclease V subunit alpha [Actinoplanes hulinensis]|uniref:RecBCD enzyme subunit RecD n=1 Tax=Actinoplanes hulinensis TaxID=1144547 RepID=A0ABS7BEI0_9ACTN|nr:exodeoxyribonuclease V subunit alpha [Actinoplanes hulinensis]MBW6439282.1 exodeoxyribonuclease V subunit alpha [Actinoplanes hulinensis]
MTAPAMAELRVAHGVTGILHTFNEAGVLNLADVHTAHRITRLGGDESEPVQLALALTVRALRLGSVCIDLNTVGDTAAADGEDPVDITALPWPQPEQWRAACDHSPLVARGTDAPPGRPLRLANDLLYLDRYWHEEDRIRRELRQRAATDPPVDLPRLRSSLDRLFPDADRQRHAAAVSALRAVSVLAGGPGTGKTTTIARLLAVLHDQPGDPPRIALAAPTGKAAARLQEAVQQVTATLTDADRAGITDLHASTLHRLLGRRPGTRTGFRHDRTNRLPYDVVVVDETSMVPLTLMARLLEAVRPDARLILVGDPDQLASVEAGAVLGDLVHAHGTPDLRLESHLREVGAVPAGAEPTINGVVVLDRTWRFGGAIAELARHIRAGDADQVIDVLRRAPDGIEFVDTGTLADRRPTGLDGLRADILSTSRVLTDAARRGDVDAALYGLDTHRLLCAHRRGPYGVSRWTTEIETWLATDPRPSEEDSEWYPGRPLIVTANDYDLGLYNGDTGVVVRDGGGVRAAFARGGAPVLVPPSRLSDVQTVYAMTIHRGQGSQFHRVSLILPPAESPLLTRELLYTAITRARSHVRILGTEDAVRAAVQRPITRASGLRHTLTTAIGGPA